MLFLGLLLISTIAGTGLAIYYVTKRDLIREGDNPSTGPIDKQGESSLGIEHDSTNETPNQYDTLSSMSVLSDEAKPHGEGFPDKGNQETDGSKNLVHKKVLNANVCSHLGPSSQHQKYPERNLDSKLPSNKREPQNYRKLKHFGTSINESRGRDGELLYDGLVNDEIQHVAINGGIEDTNFRTFPTTVFTAPETQIPFPLYPEAPQNDLQLNSPLLHTNERTSSRLKENISLLTSERLEIKHFASSTKGSPSKVPLIKKPPIKSTKNELRVRKSEKESKTCSAPGRKTSNPAGFGAQDPTLDTDKSPLSLNDVLHAAPSNQKPFTMVTNEELTAKIISPSISPPQVAKRLIGQASGSIDGEKRNLKSRTALKPSDFSPIPSPSQFGITSTPKILATVMGSKEVEKVAQPDALDQMLPRLVSPYLSSRQGVRRAPTNSGNNSVEIENMASFSRIPLGKLSSSKRRPVPVAYPVPKTLDFTPDHLFLSPRPFEGTSSSKTACISAKGDKIGRSVTVPPSTTGSIGSERIFLGGNSMSAQNIRPSTKLQESMKSNHINKQDLGLAAQKDHLPLFQVRRLLTPRMKKASAPSEVETLDFTPHPIFLDPRHFPQVSPASEKGPGLHTAKVFENFTAKAGDILDGQKRVLQDGSLEKPLVGRVRLASKLVGKDPKFTYATWSSAGSKRGRDMHNCGEKGGCRICD